MNRLWELFGSFSTVTVGLAMLALICFFLAALLRRRGGLPDRDVVYQDVGGAEVQTLVSRRYGLSGKPDYLMEDDEEEGLIPVEVKGINAPRNGVPYRSHLMQLAVYFVLVEDVLRQPAPYGLIRYRDQTLEIDNTDELREELFDLIGGMREVMASGHADRSHNQPRRCAGCSVAHACDQRLA